MMKLLNVNFARLFKSRFFIGCMILSFISAAFYIGSDYMDYKSNSMAVLEGAADVYIFTGGLILIFAIAAFVGIFVGTEYSDGTIRNKLIVGHKRSEIFLSNLITCSAAAVAMDLTYIFTALITQKILFNSTLYTASALVLNTFSHCIAMVAFTAICVAICMLMQTKSSSSVTVLIMTIIMFFASFLIASVLEEPEYYDQPVFHEDQETGEVYETLESAKNPSYPSKEMRALCGFLDKSLPVNQISRVMTMQYDVDSRGTMAAYSAVIILIAGGAGLMVFRKKDLK